MKDDRAYLSHIRDALKRIIEYTASFADREDFLSDTRTQDAVIRNLEIIGEAAKHVSPKQQKAATDIPWKLMAGMRDKLIHDYLGVDLDLVWEVVVQQVPDLKRRIDILLQS